MEKLIKSKNLNKNMRKLILILGILFIGMVSATNVSILYGKNTSSGLIVPLEVNDDGSLRTTLDLTESMGLNPKTDNTYNIGSAVLRWAMGYFFDFTIDNNLTVGGNVTADYYFGNGSQLTGIATTESDPFWTGNFSNVAFINKANAFGAFNQSFNTNVLFIDATNDRIGIGTTSPGAKLDLKGTAGAQDLLRLSHSASPTAAGIIMGFSADETKFNIQTEYSDAVYDTITIDRATRNVGIGTTSPSDLLTVAGTINFTTLQQTTDGTEWIKPEHIFDVDDADIETDLNTYVDIAGDTMSGILNMGDSAITSINWAGSDDGSGSGLDADLLDAQHGSYYQNADNLNAGTVPSARISQTQAYYSTDPRLPSTNQVHSTLSSPTIAELSIPSSPYVGNKLLFVTPTTSEYTTNGVDWNATTYTETELKELVQGRYDGSSIYIPSPNQGEWVALRLTFTTPGYRFLNWLYLYTSTSGHQMNIKIEKSNLTDPDTWFQVAQTNNWSSWPGHQSIPHSSIPWHPTGGTPGSHAKYVRITFYPAYNPSYPANGITIYNINWYGYYPANYQSDTWYWDYNNNFYIKENLTIEAIAAGAADYDKFLVSDGGLVKYRTGAQVLADIGAGTGDGTVTSVDSGTGLTGGPITTSGTLNVIGGTCITANANDVAVTGDCIGDTQLAFNTGQHLTTATKPQFAGVNLGGTTYYLGSGATASKLWILSINEIYADLGSASDVSYTFTGDDNTGMWSPGADTLSFSEGGSEAMRITSLGYIGIGTGAEALQSSRLVITDTDSTINLGGFRIQNQSAYGGSKYLELGLGNAGGKDGFLYASLLDSFTIQNNDVIVTGALTATTLDTGYGDNELWDMNQHVLTTSSVSFNEIYGDIGSISDPSYTFDGDTNTGLYWIGADQLGVTLGGVMRAAFKANYFEVKPSTDSYGIIVRDSGSTSYANLQNINGITYLKDQTSAGLAISGTAVSVPDHGTETTDMLSNVVYHTSACPTASTTTIGTICVIY